MSVVRVGGRHPTGNRWHWELSYTFFTTNVILFTTFVKRNSHKSVTFVVDFYIICDQLFHICGRFYICGIFYI